MYEYESNKADQDKVAEIVAQGDQPQPLTPAMYEARIQELISEVERLSKKTEDYNQAWKKLRDNIDQAEQAFKDVLEGDVEAADIIQSYSEAFTLLGWEFSSSVDVEIQVTWRGTIELPFGTKVEDLDIMDFNLNEPCHDEYSTWFDMDDYEIRDR